MEFLQATICKNGTDVAVPCAFMHTYEASDEVIWPDLNTDEEKREDLVLQENKREREETEDGIRVAKKYVRVTSFLPKLIAAIRLLIRYYMPSNDMMDVVSALDQTKWTSNPRSILTNDKIMSGLNKWASQFDLEDKIPSLQEDIEKLVDTLSGSDVNWCQIRQSKPTSFWNYLLIKGLLPSKIEKLVELTITIPYGR